MAARTPSTVNSYPVDGGFMKTIFYFTDLDDNDTFASGIKSMQAFSFGSTVDNSDLSIDAYDRTTGGFTFGTIANNAGYLTVLHMGY